MRTNTVKQKLLRGEPSIGAEAGLGSVLSAEALSRVGFDYVVVDMQHGAWTETSVMHAFRAIALGSALPMARVRSNDFGLIGRLLDIGAMGVIVPLVNSVEDAEKAVLAARYPPLGRQVGREFRDGVPLGRSRRLSGARERGDFPRGADRVGPGGGERGGDHGCGGHRRVLDRAGGPVGVDGHDSGDAGAYGGDPVGDRGVSQGGEDTGDLVGGGGAGEVLDRGGVPVRDVRG